MRIQSKLLTFFSFLLCLTQKGTSSSGQCVMYGQCGASPDRPWFQLNCVDNGPPRTVDNESYSLLQKYCPELVTEFGDQLCCAKEQIVELVDNLALPEAILGKCAACFYNFRQIFCNLACTPKQSEFLRVKETILNSEGRVMVKSLEAYVEDNYVQRTYNSCKEVTVQSVNGLAMDLLCGPWGADNCSPTKWFDYMGSTSNGFAPFDIFYKYVKEDEEFDGVTPFHAKTFTCSELVGDNPPTRCACQDCKDSCSLPKTIVQVLEMKEMHKL